MTAQIPPTPPAISERSPAIDTPFVASISAAGRAVTGIDFELISRSTSPFLCLDPAIDWSWSERDTERRPAVLYLAGYRTRLSQSLGVKNETLHVTFTCDYPSPDGRWRAAIRLLNAGLMGHRISLAEVVW